MRLALLAAAVLLLASCAVSGGGETAMTAIYSPPVRLGGAGSMIFLPTTARKIPPPLERADTVPKPTTAAWLAGTWIQDATAEDVERAACNSGTTITYRPDGTYHIFEGRGRWTLKGDRVTDVLDAVYESADDDIRRLVGRRERYIVRRVGPNEALLSYGTEPWIRMLRCRPGDIR